MRMAFGIVGLLLVLLMVMRLAGQDLAASRSALDRAAGSSAPMPAKRVAKELGGSLERTLDEGAKRALDDEDKR